MNSTAESALHRLPIPTALEKRLQRHVDRALRHSTVAYPALRIVVKEVCEAMTASGMSPGATVVALRDAVAMYAREKGFQRASLLTGADASAFVVERVRVWAELTLERGNAEAPRSPGSSHVVEWQRSIGMHPTEREAAEIRRLRREARS